ncbi:Adenylate cyclase 1 [Diplonema papillatum]|nr:Adenylate cyclase 1 [Diplonema papillatum]
MRSLAGLMFAVLGPCAWAQPTETTTREEFSGVGFPPLIVASFVALGCIVVSLVVMLIARRRIRLAYALFIAVLTCGLVVGGTAWLVMGNTVTTSVHEILNDLLEARGNQLEREISTQLEVPLTMRSYITQRYEEGVLDIANVSLSNVDMLIGVYDVFGDLASGVGWVYYGTETGYSLGVSRLGNGMYDFWYSWPINGEIPPELVCQGWDRDDAACEGVVCGVSPETDEACGKTCGLSSHELCVSHGDSNSRNGMGTLAYWTAHRDDYLVPVVVSKTGYMVHDTVWYTLVDQPVWSEPYVYAGSWDTNPVGYSATVGFRDAAGEWAGIAGADITLVGVVKIIAGLVPTENAVIALADRRGLYLGGSRVIESTTADLYNISTVPDATLVSMFSSVLRRYTTVLKAIDAGSSILQDTDSVVLSKGIQIPGDFPLLAVLMIPYADFLEETEDALDASLVTVIALSACCSLLVAGIMLVALLPLQYLVFDMLKIAQMDVDDITTTRGTVLKELHQIQTALGVIVGNMRVYREFMPSSVMNKRELVEDEDTTMVERTEEESARSSGASMTMSNTRQSDTAEHIVHLRLEMSRKDVTVAAFNLRRTHAMLNGLESFQQHYRTYLETVVRHGKEASGCVDQFCGDRLSIGFNTVTKSWLHRTNAVQCAVRSVVELASPFHSLECTVGIAAGKATCGFSGCHGLKRYNILGPVVGAANILEQTARLSGYPVLADAAVAKTADPYYILRKLRNVTLPHSSTPQVISSILSVRGSMDQEWMYSLAESKTKAYTLYNEAVCHLVLGNLSEAEDSLECCDLDIKEELLARIYTCRAGGEKELTAVPELCYVVGGVPERIGKVHSGDRLAGDDRLAAESYRS